MNHLNIAICGAGPAGLSAAIALHREGHHITIFDQFDAPKPIGSGLILQPAGLAVLEWLGLALDIRQLGAPITKLSGKSAKTGRIVLDVRYAGLGGETGLAVHRAGLFYVLHTAVKNLNIKFKMSSFIIGLDSTTLILDQGERHGPFDLIIDGLGGRSPLIKNASGPDRRRSLQYGAIWASLPWPGAPFDDQALEQRYEAASVMIGVLPIGKRFPGDNHHAAFFWSLKSADYTQWQAEGLDRWKSHVAQLWPETQPLLNTILSADQMTMARYDHHTLSLPFGDSLVFIGDSAHSTSPQLGQGANMALLDVMALTGALKTASTLQQALHNYAAARRWHVRLYQAMSAIFTPFYQSDSQILPMLRDYLVAGASMVPSSQKLLANLVAGKLMLK
ncbi:MAG: FAD-dependent monooxygenase [Alphaproteobacteria bacterium]|nr:FAD-dependent monooxygenase [Alphaproteobacteria bacterium]